MDSRHQVRKDAFGNIHVNLDSSTPCWNDAMEGFCLNRYFFFVKTDLGTMQWTPLRISTTCVTRQSATIDVSE